MIFAIDPGTTKSAFVLYHDREILLKGIDDNEDLIEAIREAALNDFHKASKLHIEMVASYGMAVGKSVFETCVWIGRFIEAWDRDWGYVYRKDEKMHLCGQTKAKDSNIRLAIIDRYGSERSIAIGTKGKPGALYGVSKDIWAALGVAITADET